jgi:hypothetical protein
MTRIKGDSDKAIPPAPSISYKVNNCSRAGIRTAKLHAKCDLRVECALVWTVLGGGFDGSLGVAILLLRWAGFFVPALGEL